MKKIGIYNESGEDVPYLTTVKKVIKKAMEMEKIDAELNIIIVDDDYIWKLNRDYRHIDRPTDVITFALEAVCNADCVNCCNSFSSIFV